MFVWQSRWKANLAITRLGLATPHARQNSAPTLAALSDYCSTSFSCRSSGSHLVGDAPVDTRPPEVVLHAIEPNKPLLAESEQQVTFILRDENDGIPTVFVFEDEHQKGTALGINTIRRTPNERGVEIRFEAIRFRRDENDPDRLWVRAVGIANESEGKTPVSLSQLESGEPLDLRFRDEIKVPYVAHVIYEILMTIQYAPANSADLAHEYHR